MSTKPFYNISKTIKYLFAFKNISESENYNVAMKYFSIFDKNIATIFLTYFMEIFLTCFCNILCYVGCRPDSTDCNTWIADMKFLSTEAKKLRGLVLIIFSAKNRSPSQLFPLRTIVNVVASTYDSSSSYSRGITVAGSMSCFCCTRFSSRLRVKHSICKMYLKR